MRTVATPPQPPSTATLRVRRARERRQRGEAIVTLEIGSGVRAGLIALGWLPEPDNADKGAIARALIQIVERAIQAHVIPSTGLQSQICFVCDLQPTTIDTLISLGWLPGEFAGDFAAIVKAFRRFAGRALDVALRGELDLWNLRRR